MTDFARGKKFFELFWRGGLDGSRMGWWGTNFGWYVLHIAVSRLVEEALKKRNCTGALSGMKRSPMTRVSLEAMVCCGFAE